MTTLLFFSGLLGFVHNVHAATTSAEQAITEIRFCMEVTSPAEAERKAELAEILINSATCWKANNWTLEVHRNLLASDFKLEMFIPSYYSSNGQRRLEIFVWYADSGGRKRNFWNSCGFSDEALQYIAKHPQTSC